MYAGIIEGTLMYARINMGIPLTLYDVCVNKGPSMISTEFTLPYESCASHGALIYNKPQGENSYHDGVGDYYPWKKDH